jgi:hypothetical protein
MNYSNLWTQDASRRLGYAIDAAIYGKDLQAELHARLPKMTKAQVDTAVRKYLSTKDLSIAIVSDKGQELKDKLASGDPTPIVYDTSGTAPDILEEDKIIEKLALPVGKDAITVVPVEKMFE